MKFLILLLALSTAHAATINSAASSFDTTINSVADIDNERIEAMYAAKSEDSCHVVHENIDDMSEELSAQLYDQCEDQAY